MLYLFIQTFRRHYLKRQRSINTFLIFSILASIALISIAIDWCHIWNIILITVALIAIIFIGICIAIFISNLYCCLLTLCIWLEFGLVVLTLILFMSNFILFILIGLFFSLGKSIWLLLLLFHGRLFCKTITKS